MNSDLSDASYELSVKSSFTQAFLEAVELAGFTMPGYQNPQSFGLGIIGS